MSDPIRVRFAPSPTGPLHIGGIRTALFNYLFACKHKGTFILRIEDTDQTRFVPKAEEYIIESLKWCGLKIDEGVSVGGPYAPYRQSDRKEIYKKYIDKLIQSGNAYYSFDSPEEIEVYRKNAESKGQTFSYGQSNRNTMKNSISLDAEKTQKLLNEGTPFAIRFKMPENVEIQMKDIIRGEVRFNTSTLDDKVLFKSDGLPTYHLANVTDDYEMKITHVIRGEEWLPSLPLHVMLYKALGIEKDMPQFAHLPLILKPSGKGKLSKRDGDKEGFPVIPIEWKSPEHEISSGYRESGYFPEALVNMLALLGWNPGTEQEILSMKELIDLFSLEKVQKGGARFDPEKTRWFNQQYLKMKSDKELSELLLPVLKEKNIEPVKEKTEKICGLLKERAVFVDDLWKQGHYFFKIPDTYDEKAIGKFWQEDTANLVKEVKELIAAISPFTSAKIEETIKVYLEKKQMGFGKVMNPLRICIVGAAVGPHLFDIMEIIGKDETLNRIDIALQKLKL